jgi:hypothetical protein
MVSPPGIKVLDVLVGPELQLPMEFFLEEEGAREN